jgi:hypothetical protein
MRPVRVLCVGAVTSSIVPLDQYQTPFNVSLVIAVVSGAISVTVSYTFDDVFDSTVTPAWTNHADLTTKTAAAIGTFISPVRAVRMVNTDTGTAALTILQAGAQ